MILSKKAGAIAASFLLFACSLHQVREDYPEGIETPQSFSRRGGAPLQAEPWWQSLGDPDLTWTVQQVLEDNPGILQAWSRLGQAEALARRAAASQLPEASVEASASRSRSTFFAGGESGERDVTTSLFGLSLGSAYEVDLWKKIAHRRRAAEFSARASRGDLEAAMMSLAAGTAELWFSIAEQKAQLELLRQQEEVSRTFLELQELRFSLGQASALDLYQQRQQLANTRSGIPLLQRQHALLRHQLSILMGRPPRGLPREPGPLLPVMPPLPDPGLPADLLLQRPDVRAADLRIRSADHSVGEAIAELLPSLRLGGEAGYQGTAIEKTFDNLIYRIAASLAGPLFDGGRRRSEVTRRKEVLEERLYAYRETVLRALGEVEDALVREERQGAYTAQLREQIELAENTLEQARTRYGNGLSDYLAVLTALQALQRLERAELASRKQTLSDRIQLYRALGGSWAGMKKPGRSISRTVINGERLP